MKKKNPFTRLSDNQEYLIECVCMFDRSKDIKHKVIKETKYYYILENGDKISKIKGRWLSNVNNKNAYSTLHSYYNGDGSTYDGYTEASKELEGGGKEK